MLFWLMIAGIVLAYIWGVRRIAWIILQDTIRPLDGEDVAYGLFFGFLLGWTFPLLFFYFSGKRLANKYGFQGPSLDKLVVSAPKTYED